MTASVMYIIVVISTAIMSILCIVAIGLFRESIKINPLLEKRDKLLNEIRIASDTLDELKIQIEKQSGAVAANESIIAKGEEIKKFIDENGGNVSQLKQLIDDKKNALEALNKAVKIATDDRDNLNKDLVAIKKQLGESNQTIKDNLCKKQELLDEINLKNDECTKIKNNLKDLKEDLRKLSIDVEKKSKELERLKDDLKPKENLENKIKELSKIRDNLTHDVSGLKTKEKGLLGSLEAKKELANDIWSDLDRTIDFKNKYPKKKSTESHELHEFARALKDNNISFPTRTINAFHTGLKTADSSPIVVLSGISGTGKSLLPKLYSDFMGMNFTSMAVQPRWDSPQDMLGFYNYMQQRYKATELSRLLWQYNFYNNTNCKNKYKVESELPMNIVLLDEMNIAKVEYYFSDMLSKLELRRTIDKTDDNSRSAAEIEIECGALDNNNKARRLFINNNFLFVGTMNEDETTQVLSDKVLDRSNVIRFGKPEKLQATANTLGFTKKCDLEASLTLKQWTEDWCKPNVISATDSKKLEDTINNINIQLEKVNRPFGHRVWNSIENYIKLYPEGKNSFKNALSDQIEMKILTKLNGLEKDNGDASEVLNEIGSIISNIHDDDLSNAYQAAKDDNSNAFFQWHGVIR